MRNFFWLLLVCFSVLPASLAAETLPLVPGLALQLELPSERWTLSREAPPFLVAETAEHLEHELLAQGKKVDAAALRVAAEKRLAANEAYVCNLTSGACLAVDFSALRDGESAPSRRTLAESARLSGESLESEEGATEVVQKSSRSSVTGAENAYRVDATYRHHGVAQRFVGIIGFVAPYWFYLYYTDPLRDPADLKEMEQILKALALVPAGGN